jgi:hypothetical protein
MSKKHKVHKKLRRNTRRINTRRINMRGGTIETVSNLRTLDDPEWKDIQIIKKVNTEAQANEFKDKFPVITEKNPDILITQTKFETWRDWILRRGNVEFNVVITYYNINDQIRNFAKTLYTEYQPIEILVK